MECLNFPDSDTWKSLLHEVECLSFVNGDFVLNLRQSRLGKPSDERIWTRMLEKGLGLIEVVLVLALAMALAATIIPKVLGSRIVVNEAKAITSLRVIAS